MPLLTAVNKHIAETTELVSIFYKTGKKNPPYKAYHVLIWAPGRIPLLSEAEVR